MFLGQETPEQVVPLKNKLVPWVAAPEASAQLEAELLQKSLDELNKATQDTYSELERIKSGFQQSEMRLAQAREGLARERGAVDPSAPLEIPLDLFSEESRLILTKSGLSGWGSKFKDALHKVEQYTIRPAVEATIKKPAEWTKEEVWEPTREVGKEFEKAFLRPIGEPLQIPLHKLEKYTLRPGLKHVATGTAILDQYVPGWTVLLDFVIPIPIGIGQILGNLSLVMQQLVTVSPAARAAARETIVGTATVGVVTAAQDLARPIVMKSAGVVEWASGIKLIRMVEPFPLTMAKGTKTYIETQGPIYQKLIAVSVEIAQGIVLTIGVATMVMTFGMASPGMMALQAALGALNATLVPLLKSGVNMVQAWQAAQIIRGKAREIAKLAAIEIDRINRELEKTLAEIAMAKAEYKLIEKQWAEERARIAEQQKEMDTAQAEVERKRLEAERLAKVSEQIARLKLKAETELTQVERVAYLFGVTPKALMLGTAVTLTVAGAAIALGGKEIPDQGT